MFRLFPHTDKIHRRIRFRTALYVAIALVLIGIVIFHIVRDRANILLCVVGMVIGCALGLIVSRMFKISWDKHASQVTGTFDAIGIVILVLYMLFEIFRNRIVEYFVHGPSVIAVSFSVFAGIMFGRVIGTQGKVEDIFHEQGLLE